MQSSLSASMIDALRACLMRGWERFCASEEKSVYADAFDFFKKVGLYEGLFRPQIPNPAYDNAAKNLGREFMEFSSEQGIYYSELFPGDFSISTEVEVDGIEARRFELTAMRNGKPAGRLTLVFPHSHERLEFFAPPILEYDPPSAAAADGRRTIDFVTSA